MRVIDLFAGAGGFSTGAVLAGMSVVWCANHWPQAVAIHELNHPDTIHACQDLHQVNWNVVPAHDILLASPACQGHSTARGKDLPYHDAMRSTAWAVVSCLEVHRPKAFIVENVPGFLKWELYDVWALAMERLGYSLTTQVLNAKDFGLPQSRARLFIVGTQGRSVSVDAPQMAPVTMRSIIDWDKGTWNPVEMPGRSPMVLKQFRNGKPHWGERFLIGYHSDKTKGISIDGPIGTITTKDQWAAVQGDTYRMLSIDEYRRAMGFPADYILPARKVDALKMLGNAVPPAMAAHIIASLARQLAEQPLAIAA